MNALGALLFSLAAAGHPPALLPLAIPPVYAAQIAWVIGLFGAVYLFLALSHSINRPLLLIGALGKLGFVAIFTLFAAAGTISWAVVLQAMPDLALGSIYLAWLVGPQKG